MGMGEVMLRIEIVEEKGCRHKFFANCTILFEDK